MVNKLINNLKTKIRNLKLAICFVFFNQITHFVRWHSDTIVNGHYVIVMSFGIYDWLHFTTNDLIVVYMDYGYFVANTRFLYLSSDAKRFLITKFIMENKYDDSTNNELNQLVQKQLNLSDTRMMVIREEIIPYA